MNAILQFFPELLDVNGDSQNALVLTQRARWAGLEAELVTIGIGDDRPIGRPAAIVIGSSVDSALAPVRAAFVPFEAALREWVASGVPLLAVGTGFELLTSGIQLAPGESPLEGLGLLPGRAVPLPERAVGDLVVDAAEGRLIGFENHARGVELADGTASLGAVVSGTGNGAAPEGSRVEGARAGSVVGTHLHGPVLAKNPALADAMLSAAFGDAYRRDDPRIRFVDEAARNARQAIATKLGVSPS